MKNRVLILVILATLSTLSGCYTPPGGSSIPWNEPTPNGDGSFNPRVNF